VAEVTFRTATKQTWIRIGTARNTMMSGCARICSPWKPNRKDKRREERDQGQRLKVAQDAGHGRLSAAREEPAPPNLRMLRKSLMSPELQLL